MIGYVSVAEAGRKLGLQPSTVRDLIYADRLAAEPKTCSPSRTHWLVSVASIESYIAERRKLFAAGRERRKRVGRK